MVAAAEAGSHALLVAPTGGGKTLAGFLPSLIDLAERGPRPPHGPGSGVHTLYLSPLKALTTDVERNLMTPIREIGLNIHVESRTGDTKQSKRQRQRDFPPDILLTTPEQLALFCAWDGARAYFADLKCVVLDEVHAIWSGKRGDLLSLGLGRLQKFAPEMRRVALSATVDDPEMIAGWLKPAPDAPVAIVLGDPGAPPVIDILVSEGHVPWAGHTGVHAVPEVYDAIRGAGMTLIFVNTRWQAEFVFQQLWAINDDSLPIALHHGSLAAEQRRKVEAAMARGDLRAVVCTSTLDLGIDWGDVDLVIQLAAPKGASRLVQRIGRANHRLDEPSRALMVPASRFEMLECQAAREAVAENAFDWEPVHIGTLDTLAQHVMGCACSEPFDLNDLYAEVSACGPYRGLTWESFEEVVDLVATGGYALRTYDRFARIVRTADGRWKVRNAQLAQSHRMNVGAIVSAANLNVKVASRRAGGKHLIGGRKIGEAEEWYFEQMEPGDTFVFAGQVWAFQGITGTDALVSPAVDKDPKIPSYGGSKFPLGTSLAERVRDMVQDRDHWRVLPPRCAGMAGVAGGPVAYPARRRDADRDLPARQPPFHGLLPVRRPAGAHHPGHAADQAAGPDECGTSGLRRHRLFAGHLGDQADGPAGFRRPVRARHAGRRPRKLAGGELHDEAHLPQLRPDLRPDRAAPAGSRKDRAAGDLLDRPDLRRAASPPARSPAAAHRPRRRRLGPAGRGAAGPAALPHPGADRASAAGAALTLLRAGSRPDRS